MTREINTDILLLSIFTNKTIYNYYYSYINNYLVNNYKSNNKLLYKIYRVLELLHKEHDTVSLEDILLRLQREYPALPADERELAQETLQKAAGAIFNEGEVHALVQRQYDACRASDVALKAIQVTEGKAELADFQKILEEDNLQTEEKEEIFYENDLEGLYQTTKGAHGLRWPLAVLNKSLGSLRPGDFGFFFARPEVGKTTFLAHVVTHAIKESGKSVLWINNEEGGNKVLLRCYQSMLGVTTKELFANIGANEEKYNTLCGQKLRLVNDPSIKREAIERLVIQTNPILVVVDQLDKLVGFEAERNDLILKAKYQWARELAKKYGCSVIGVCQAGGTAEGKKRLLMTDVDSSHTAKQGEADWVLGIGKTNDEGFENVRYFNLCKNKLVGDEDSDENLRHGFFDVLIRPDIGRYEDRIKWD